MEEQNLDFIGILVFGNLAIVLFFNSFLEVVGMCILEEDWEVFVVFFYMYYMGIFMVVEVGFDVDSLEEVFCCDFYDFDDQ